jgi:hypothetical protein
MATTSPEIWQQLLVAVTSAGAQSAGGPATSLGQKENILQAGWTSTGANQTTQLQQLLTLFGGAAPLLFGDTANLTGPALLTRLKGLLQQYATTGVPRASLGAFTESEYVQALNDLISRYDAAQKEQQAAGIAGEDKAVSVRTAEAFGKTVTDAIAAATKLGGPAALQAKRIADLYQSYLLIQATAAGGPTGSLATEALAKLNDAMTALGLLTTTQRGQTTAGFSVNRTFTVAQGDIVAGELRTANIHLERIEAYLARMAGGLAATFGPSTGTFGSTGFLSIQQLTITLPSGADVSDPGAWAAAAVAEFDAKLGAKYQNAAILVGSPNLG